jgi:hypothetical protein
MTDTPAQYSKAQRRLLTAFSGLGVLALAASTFVLSYDDLRALAIQGGAVRHRAFLYPGMVDGLVVVVVLSIMTARRARWASRAVRWLLLLALVTGAGAAGVQRAVKGYGALPHAWVSGGVAAAPWAILAIAVWLWLAIIKQALSLRTRPERPTRTPDPVPATIIDKTIVPGLADPEPEDTRPLPRPGAMRELEPVRTAEPDPERISAPAVADHGEPDNTVAPAAHPDPTEPEPEPMVEAPMNDTPVEPAKDEPAPRLVARSSLPTDVRLVGGPRRKPDLSDTQPDGIRLPDTQPDGIPIVSTAEDDDDTYAEERAEYPDAGEVTTGADHWADETPEQPGQRGRNPARKPGDDPVESTPPSSKFRSSPTPPRG